MLERFFAYCNACMHACMHACILLGSACIVDVPACACTERCSYITSIYISIYPWFSDFYIHHRTASPLKMDPSSCMENSMKKATVDLEVDPSLYESSVTVSKEGVSKPMETQEVTRGNENQLYFKTRYL